TYLFFTISIWLHLRPPLFPYTTLFRSNIEPSVGMRPGRPLPRQCIGPYALDLYVVEIDYSGAAAVRSQTGATVALREHGPCDVVADTRLVGQEILLRHPAVAVDELAVRQSATIVRRPLSPQQPRAGYLGHLNGKRIKGFCKLDEHVVIVVESCRYRDRRYSTEASVISAVSC